MPQYLFKCSKCEHSWEKTYSYSEYEKIVLPKKEKCIKCKKSKFVHPIFTPPNINLGNTLGAVADKNTKLFGGKLNEQESKKQEIKKKGHKPNWYGSLGKKKMKEIFSETNPKEQKRKMNKYIREGK